MMKKIYFLLAFVAMTQLADAQWLVFWKGDQRMGLDAGMNVSFYNAKFVGPLAGHIVDDVKMAVSPSVGLHWGMEKDLNKKTAFGFNTDFQITSTHWSVSFGENSSNNVLYKVKSTTLNMMEGIYFAFDIKKMKRKKKFQALAGVGVYEDIRFKGKISEEVSGLGYATVLSASELAMSAYASEDTGIPFSFDFGVDVLAGIQYRFNENFFVQGRLVYMLPLFGSDSSLDDFTSNSDDFGKSKLNPFVWYRNDKINRISLVATIGFRW